MYKRQVIGGGVGYIFFFNLIYYSKNFIDSFKLWEGGMSFHGGLIGVIVATIIFSKIKKINFFNLTDIIACVSPIGIFFGRIANFINGELYGKPTIMPWAVIFPTIDNIPRHQSQIYEAILEGGILLIIIIFLELHFLKEIMIQKTINSFVCDQFIFTCIFKDLN